MPPQLNARHRARGIGRLITVRSATPRHAALAAAPGATAELPVIRARRRPWALITLALLVPAVAPVAVYALRRPDAPQAAVPLPTFSVAPPPTSSGSPTATPRRLRAVPQAAKATIALTPAPPATKGPAPTRTGTRVLLGPATAGELPGLLSAYCQATYGRFTLAVSTPGGWACGTWGRQAGIDMGAMCRWRYGDRARAEQGSAADPGSWRCYRDRPQRVP